MSARERRKREGRGRGEPNGGGSGNREATDAGTGDSGREVHVEEVERLSMLSLGMAGPCEPHLHHRLLCADHLHVCVRVRVRVSIFFGCASSGKEYLKAIAKRLQNKNPHVVKLALEVGFCRPL